MVKYFKNPFAVNGDRTAIPEITPPDGSVSFEDGFGVNYQLDPGVDSDALDIPRNQFNQMIFDVTSAIQQYQQRGFPDFITASDNGGTPYAYEINATVRHNNVNYYSLVGGNTTTPPSASWGLVVYSQGVAPGTPEIWLFNTIKAGGYVWLNGTTIGNAASNATQRANADTQTIYELIWNDYSNTLCPIFTSAGAASTRGVSAAADYALNKALSTPDFCGRGMFFMDNMGGIAAKNRITTAGSGISGTTLGASGGEQNVSLTSNQNGIHTHTGSTDSAGSHFHNYTTGSGERTVLSNQPANAEFNTVVQTLSTASAGAHTHGFTTTSSGLGEAHQNMPPAIMTGGLIMKL